MALEDEPKIDAAADTLGALEVADGDIKADPETPAIPDDEPEELTITIEGEEPEADEFDEAELGEKGLNAVRKLREKLREEAKEARKAKARLAELEAAGKPKVEAPKRPTLEECGFDEELFTQRTEAYVIAQAEARKAQESQEAARKAEEEDYTARHSRYTEAKKALRVPDYEAAEDVVREKLTVAQQSVLLRTLPEPEKVIYALGKSKKALDELSGVKDLDRFAYRLAKLEGEIKVTTKTPPPPEGRLKGGAGAAPPTSGDLEAMRRKAEASGDYSAYFAAKRAAKEAGVKV